MRRGLGARSREWRRDATHLTLELAGDRTAELCGERASARASRLAVGARVARRWRQRRRGRDLLRARARALRQRQHGAHQCRAANETSEITGTGRPLRHKPGARAEPLLAYQVPTVSI